MEFDINKVYTAVNADELQIGSKGFVADTLYDLKQNVALGDDKNIATVVHINDDGCERRFMEEDRCEWHFFYLLKEPKKDFPTYKELAFWLASGNGEYRSYEYPVAFTTFNYRLENENKAIIANEYRIRKWGETEWQVPTREYMGLE